MNKGLQRVKCIHCDGYHYVRKPRGERVGCYICKKTRRPFIVYIERK